jgi:hypothetical protein
MIELDKKEALASCKEGNTLENRYRSVSRSITISYEF